MISRRPFIALVVITAFFLTSGIAQQKKDTGPRAVAVVEWTGHELRLIPVSLLIDGRFYDASLYRADPIPLALDQGNVYQVQSAGQVVGDFTVGMAAQTPNGSWVGEGSWLSEVERRNREEKRAKAEAATAAAEAAERNRNPLDDRPVLKRGKAGAADTPSSPSSNPPASAPPATTANAKPAVSTPAAATPPAAPIDPNRPILRRGKPAEEQAKKLGNEKLESKKPQPPPDGIREVQVAVSDASAGEPRPYAWKWESAEEQQKMTEQVEKFAMAEVAAYAAKVNGPKPGAVQDVEMHAFDLAYNNSPDVVFTAKVVPAVPPAPRKGSKEPAPPVAAPEGFEYYVTVVARQDIYGELRKSFSSVTDNRHLDAFPRFQLVDAVDADGNGGGELLFRRSSDRSSAFVIYKVYGSRMDELVSVPEPKMLP